MPIFKVFTGMHDVFRAVPTTLPVEREARRFGLGKSEDASIVADAKDEREARTVAFYVTHSDPDAQARATMEMRGPKKKVPVFKLTPPPATPVDVCQETAYGSKTRLSYQIRVF